MQYDWGMDKYIQIKRRILNIESYYQKIKIHILLRKKRFYRLIECTERVANAICFYGMA